MLQNCSINFFNANFYEERLRPPFPFLLGAREKEKRRPISALRAALRSVARRNAAVAAGPVQRKRETLVQTWMDPCFYRKATAQSSCTAVLLQKRRIQPLRPLPLMRGEGELPHGFRQRHGASAEREGQCVCLVPSWDKLYAEYCSETTARSTASLIQGPFFLLHPGALFFFRPRRKKKRGPNRSPLQNKANLEHAAIDRS